MAQLKQLSAGSSQIIMMMFRDKNNAPIKADSVHVKGSMRIAEEKTSISRVTIRKYINKNKPYKNILFYESKNNNS